MPENVASVWVVSSKEWSQVRVQVPCYVCGGSDDHPTTASKYVNTGLMSPFGEITIKSIMFLRRWAFKL